MLKWLSLYLFFSTVVFAQKRTIVNQDSDESFTNVQRKYILEHMRLEDLNYFNVNFYIKFDFLESSSIYDYENRKFKNKEKKAFYAGVESCIQDVNKYLWKDENNILKLKIHYIEKEFPVDAPVIDIRIHRKYWRANTENMKFDADCHTITHETLHWTGLVDLYADNEMEDGELIHPLRIKESVPNIMGMRAS